jgi:CubicO group peptidase (beta-lactamase class C family)
METVQPESMGFSRQRLGRINRVMQQYVEDKKLAGIVTLIARHGKVVHFDKFGMADISGKKPMQTNSLFRIYSMTKPITSTAVLMLFEEGRFRLTDPVHQYIPAFKDVKVLDNAINSDKRLIEPSRSITIRDLLTHTAGLSYGFDDNFYIDELYRRYVFAKQDRNPNMTLEEMVTEIARIPLTFHPGSNFRYSMATDVLGYLVQLVSGLPFEDFLKQRIFDPLAMVDSAFYVPPEKVGRFTVVYGPDKKGGMKAVEQAEGSRYLNPPKAPSGGGGLVSTTQDYLRFCQMLLNYGELEGVRLLGRKTVELMTLDHLPASVDCFGNPHLGFGLGVSVLRDLAKSQNLGSAGNYGWGGAANTDFWIDPKENLIGILMLQYMPRDAYTVMTDFRNLVYQALID